MIHVKRDKKPNWFSSPQVREVFEEQRLFMEKQGNKRPRVTKSGGHDLNRFTVPMDEDMERILVHNFKNKCPFCESLLTGTPEEHFTEEISKCQEELREWVRDEEKGEDFKKGISRGFSNYRTQKSEEGFELYDIGFFRPEGRAMNTDGSVDPSHYWWLGWDWHNIFIICNACLTAKENKFPITAAVRAPFPDKGLEQLRDGLEKEGALLIDPCHKEAFEKREIIFEEGRAIGVEKKGQQCIDIFELNRPRLLAVRQLVSKAIAKKIEEALKYPNAKRKILSSAHPFVAASIDAWWLNTSQDQKALRHLEEIFDGDLPAYIRKEAEENDAYTHEQISSIKKQYKTPSYDLEKKENLETYFTKSLWIERVNLKNFKAFSKLELVFPNVSGTGQGGELTTSMHRPWLALLGENGVGKSSISQALALALMGKSKLEALKLDLNEFVRLGEDFAIVEVYLWNRENPIVLRIERTSEGSGLFTLTEETPQVLLMAYGASRLTSPDDIMGTDGDSFIRTSNLFNPYAHLGDGLAWLADSQRVPDNLFNLLKEGLGNLLPIEESREIERDASTGQVYLRKIAERNEEQEAPTPFKYLSSGYRTVLAFTLDIMMGAAELIGSLSNKERYSILDVSGIVMIDEIGVHLHPSWKMRIAKMLKRTFPKMSFIITTHDPLCLRGLEAGEVVLLERDENNIIHPRIDLPSPAKMRVGQLLTSVFGLNTTMDPDLEPQYTEYYHLLGLSERTEAQSERLKLLEDNLKPDLMLGETIQDRATYRVIAQKISEFKAKPGERDLSSISGDILDDASDLLDNL